MATQTDGAGDLRERPIGELLQQLSQETTTLVRKELELAKAEMAEKGKQAGIGAGMFGAAGIVGLLALGALTACLILALDGAMKDWLAALVVAAAYALVAGILALVARSRVREATPPVPEETVDSVKEDVQWAKTHARSSSR